MKEDNDHKIDQFFRDSLEDLNIIPPADVWNNIARNLPEKKSRGRIVWIAVAASVAVFAAFSGWNYLNKTAGDRVVPAETIAVQTEKHIKNNTSTPENSSGIMRMTEDTPASSPASAPQTEVPEKQLAGNVKQEWHSVSENSRNEQKQTAVAVFTSNREASENSVSKELSGDDVNSTDQYLAAIGIDQLEIPDAYENRIGNIRSAPDSVPVYDDIFAYEEDSEDKRRDRWAIGGQMAPLYSYRSISEVNAPGISKASMNQVEKAVVTYASGIMVDFEASPRLSFQTGVYYMKMGQEIDNISNLAQPVSKMNKNLAYAADLSAGINNKQAVTNSTGTIVAPAPDLYFNGSLNVEMQAYAPGNLPLSPANISKKNIEQSFEFIEVPFLAKYKIINRKINVHLLGGVSTHVLVDNKAVLKDENTSVEGKTAGVETLNYSSSVGFGVGYTMRKNLSFNVEPTFKYYLNSFNTGDAVRLHPYAFGLYSGVLLKF